MEINKVLLWQSAQLLEESMREIGVVNIQYSTEHRELEEAVASLEKGALGENFTKSLHTLPPNKFMWIRANDASGKPISVVAARLDDTGSWSLQRFIREHFNRVILDEDWRPVRLTEDSAQFASGISGRCVYLGEGYAAPQFRRQGLATLLIKYLTLIAWDEWKPEIIYAWIRRKQIETGTATKWGFTETYETPLKFETPPLDPDWSDTFFVGLRKPGVYQMIQTLQVQANTQALNNKAVG